MKTRYISFTGTTPVIIPLSPNTNPFNVSIRLPAGTPTCEYSLETQEDITAPATTEPPVTTQTQVWIAAPAAVNGVVNLTIPAQALRITPSAGGVGAVLQAGI